MHRHPGDIYQDSPGGLSCYNGEWNHIGFYLASFIFQDTRWCRYWSCYPKSCIDSFSVQWVGSWVGQYGPYWIWRLGSSLLLYTVGEGPQRSISCLGSLLGYSVCPQRMFQQIVMNPIRSTCKGLGFHNWSPPISLSEWFVVDYSIVWVEVNSNCIFFMAWNVALYGYLNIIIWMRFWEICF